MMSGLLKVTMAITLLYTLPPLFPPYAKGGEGGVTLAVSSVYADDVEWLRLGISDDGKFILYIDQKSVKKASDREVFVRVKRELSEEGQKAFKKWFDEAKIKAEKEAGSKMEDAEELLRILIKSETHEALYFFDCQGEEYRVQEVRQHSPVHLVRVYTIQKGSTEEKIKNTICH